MNKILGAGLVVGGTLTKISTMIDYETSDQLYDALIEHGSSLAILIGTVILLSQVFLSKKPPSNGGGNIINLIAEEEFRKKQKKEKKERSRQHLKRA